MCPTAPTGPHPAPPRSAGVTIGRLQREATDGRAFVISCRQAPGVIATAGAPRIATSRDGTAIHYRTLGVGEGLVVFGGAWRTGDDYMALAEALAPPFAVHVVDRRGRGGSGPQGGSYSIEREIEDLFAVQAQTHATTLFGHSYGGL